MAKTLRKPKSKARKRALTVVPSEHPLVTIARGIPDDRQRRFYATLARILPELTADDICAIEPILERRIGRIMADSFATLIPREQT